MGFADTPSGKNVLFVGPPETGKSSILTSLPQHQIVLYMDLEDPLLVRDLLSDTQLFYDVLAEVDPGEWLTINRIDRIVKYFPLLKDAIKNKKIHVAATTLSAELLEDDEVFELFQIKHFNPLSFSQVEKAQSLVDTLAYGTLPKVYNFEKPQDKIRYLKNYLQDFLDMELLHKSKIRNLVPFHLFLPYAGNLAGKNINNTILAQELNVNYKTIQNYFDLLALYKVGFYLKPYHQKIRQVQQKALRFYFFDPGFQRALINKLDYTLHENSIEFYALFKSWCIGEIHNINQKNNLNLKLFYLETKDGAGADLVIEKPDGATEFIIFHTHPKVSDRQLKALQRLGKGLSNARLIYVTLAAPTENRENIAIINYQDYLIKNFVLL